MSISKENFGNNSDSIDSRGEFPSGNSLDTHESSDTIDIKAQAELLDIERRFEDGEISREQAETEIDMLAAMRDL